MHINKQNNIYRNSLPCKYINIMHNLIKSTINLHLFVMWHAGTQISDVQLDIETAGVHTVKGFATIDEVALINVEVRLFTKGLTLAGWY